MSFLAKLRTQAPVTQEQQLCYLMEPCGDLWHLSLRLGTQRNGRLNYLESAYVVARDHLKAPPAFLSEQDLQIIVQLVNTAEVWFRQSSAQPPGLNTQGFIEQLVATNKCFVKIGSAPVLVRWGHIVKASLRWQIEVDGGQGFTAVMPKGYQLIVVGDAPLAFCRDKQTLCAIQMAGGPEYCGWHNFHLAYDQLEGFVNSSSAVFNAFEWPLPAPIPAHTVVAPLQPVLLAQTHRSPEGCSHRLALGFRVTAEQFSMYIAFADRAQQRGVYSNHKLHFIALDQALCTKLLGIVADILGSDIASVADGLWEIPEKLQWQTLFFEQQLRFSQSGIQLLADSGFAYPYTVAQNLELQASNSGGELLLELNTQVHGSSISLLQLLKTLPQQNPSGPFVEFKLSANQVLLLRRDGLESLCSELGDWVHGGCAALGAGQSYRLHLLDNKNVQGIDINLGNLANIEKIWQPPKDCVVNKNTVNAQLRPYQWLGVYWLLHIHDCGFNGLLADDMGLGKTLQTIAFLSVLKQQKKLRSAALIVAPTSLLFNWEAEFKKFCPWLKVAVLHGAQRHGLWPKLGNYDVAITSYQSLVVDAKQWQSQPLSWLILDEAQVIKNPNTQVRQTLAQFSCTHRLCLSGTPVENHLGDIWSLLDFLNPGILGAQRAFKQYYQQPIEKHGNQQRLTHLLERIAPVVLRRTKTEVATDLPEKTEITQTIELPEAQYDYYHRLKDEYWQDLQSELISTEHQGQKQMLVLTALLKLRQICCDPKLLNSGSDTDKNIASGKTEYCVNMLRELVAEGRSVLVFSQFTTMLDILASELDETGISYLQLSGKTKNRGELVESFQAGAAPVFLISLKAGGSGLNLTRADTVIHFDPWWNQAAQAQASDRAHRLGQDKPVFVYQLIAQNTIEEKIAVLQASKSALSNAVNQTAQASAHKFALGFDELLALWS